MKRFVPAIFALAVFVATAVWTPQYLEGFRVDSSTDSLVLEDDPEAIRYDRHAQTFSSDEFALVGIRRKDIFTPAGIAYVDSLARELAKIPNVASVAAITTAPALLMRSWKTQPGFGQMFALITSPQIDLQKAKQELTHHELLKDNIISRDGETTGILVTLRVRPESAKALQKKLQLFDRKRAAEERIAAGDPSAKEELDQVNKELAEFWPYWVEQEDARKDERIGVVKKVREVVKRERERGVDARVSGVPSLVVDMIEAIQSDLETFSLASLGFVLAFLLLVFRRPRWVIIPLLAVGTTVVWTVAVMYALDKRITVITSNIPSLLIVIGLAHSIHMIVRYRELLARFPDEDRWTRAKKLVRGLVWPCFFTATTTAAGFSSLYFAGSRPIIDFGFLMTLGVSLAFLFSFIFFPAAVLILPESKNEGRLERSAHALTRLATGSLRHPVGVLVLAAAVTGLSVWGCARLRVEARFFDYFSPDTPIYKGLTFIDKNLGGTSGMEVILISDEQGAFVKKENLDAAADVVKWLEDRPEVGAVMSYVGLIDELRKRMPQFDREKAGKYLGLFANMGGFTGALKPYVVMQEKTVAGKKIPAYSRVRIVCRVKETHPGLDRNELIKDLKDYLATRFPQPKGSQQDAKGGLRAEVTGMFVLYANMLKSLVGSQISTSLIALVTIWLMLTLLFQNPFAALLAVIPNIIPITFVIGLMGWVGIPLDMATVMIASVSMGIGIDAAIHYLFRFREELEVDGDVEGAILRSHGSIGTSILYTSLTSVVGFAVLVFSIFRPTAYFGLFTGFAMVAALFAMLTVLPVLIMYLQPFRKAARIGLANAEAGGTPAPEAAPAPEATPAPEAAPAPDGDDPPPEAGPSDEPPAA